MKKRIADWLERMGRRAGRLMCGVTGHALLLKYEPTRLSLACSHCGHETPGWEMETKCV